MIETERLNIRIASDDEMRKLIESAPAAEMKAAYSEMLDGCLVHPEQRPWYAVWMIELQDGTHIGELCFKGVDGGMTEIGYGIGESYQNRGYASEAVTAVSAWALKQDGIESVTAEVDTENTASVRVLEKSGFAPIGITGEEGPVYCKK